MDEFEKIKTFSESLVERQQKMDEKAEKTDQNLDLPQYLSQFRAIPPQEEKESKRMFWIVLFLCVLIVAAVIFALTKRLPEMEENEIIVISPTPTPVKVLPENPGGLNIPDRDKVVYNRATEVAPAPVVESLFSEPEQPVLPSEVIEPEDKEEVLPPLIDEVAMDEQEVVVPDETIEEVEIPLEDRVSLELEDSKEDETVVEEMIPAVPEPKPAEVQESKPAEVQETKHEEVVEPALEPMSEEKNVTEPVWRAQLLSSASKAKVESSWKEISKKQKALLSDMPYQIISATIPGKGTFWRLQVGEFTTKEMVENLCVKLRKKKQECIPVK